MSCPCRKVSFVPRLSSYCSVPKPDTKIEYFLQLICGSVFLRRSLTGGVIARPRLDNDNKIIVLKMNIFLSHADEMMHMSFSLSLLLSYIYLYKPQLHLNQKWIASFPDLSLDERTFEIMNGESSFSDIHSDALVWLVYIRMHYSRLSSIAASFQDLPADEAWNL